MAPPFCEQDPGLWGGCVGGTGVRGGREALREARAGEAGRDQLMPGLEGTSRDFPGGSGRWGRVQSRAGWLSPVCWGAPWALGGERPYRRSEGGGGCLCGDGAVWSRQGTRRLRQRNVRGRGEGLGSTEWERELVSCGGEGRERMLPLVFG